MIRRLYNWVLSWAESRYGIHALFLIAFAESSFFPIPPDVLLIGLALGQPEQAYWFALICTIGSVAGGAFGYLIGWQLMETIGTPILEFYQALDKFEAVKAYFLHYGGWAVAAAGFTPIPYKVFTIASGAVTLSFATFFLASVAGRAGRGFPGTVKGMEAFLDFLPSNLRCEWGGALLRRQPLPPCWSSP